MRIGDLIVMILGCVRITFILEMGLAFSTLSGLKAVCYTTH